MQLMSEEPNETDNEESVGAALTAILEARRQACERPVAARQNRAGWCEPKLRHLGR
jgi:hypothetical protein